MKLASCTVCLDSLECDLQCYCTKVAQTSANLEALEKHVAVTEGVLMHAGLQEIRTELREMNDKIVNVQGNWAAATKLQGCHSEIPNV